MCAATNGNTQHSPATGGGIGRWRPLRLLVLIAVLAGLGFAIRPARVRYELWQGQQLLQQGEVDEALVRFEKAERLDPRSAEPHFWLARTHRKLGDFAAVQQELESARRRGYEDTGRLQREWWLVLAEAGHLSDVEARLPELLQNAEDNAEVCEAFTNGYCLNLRFNEAHALLDAWQADYPDDFRPYLRRGQIMAGIEAWPQAEEALQDAFKRAPDDTRVRRLLAEALLHLGQLDEAQTQISSVLDDDPDDLNALMTSAEILNEQKEFTAAEVPLRRLLDLQPNDFSAQLLLAKVLLAGGKPEEAVTEAETLIGQWPDDLATIYTLAQALRAAGRTAEAEVHFDRYAQLADVLARLEELKLQVNADPDNPQLRYELGQTLLRHVSREEGKAYLESVLLYDPDHEPTHRLLADYYNRQGDGEVARQHRRYLLPSTDTADVTTPPGEIP